MNFMTNPLASAMLKGTVFQGACLHWHRIEIFGERRVIVLQAKVNATENGRIADVTELSKSVLDGGPRWVLSTALGFLTGGLWWTVVVYAIVFAVANYTMYVNTSEASWTSGAELIGLVAYTMLAVAISVASVPGEWCVSEWKSLASGLLVEVFLCVCVVVSVAIIHNIFSAALGDSASLSLWADAGRWSAPALVWVAASHRREKAVRAIETRLSSIWCSHPMGESWEELDEDVMDAHWNEWAGGCHGMCQEGGRLQHVGIFSSRCTSPLCRLANPRCPSGNPTFGVKST